MRHAIRDRRVGTLLLVVALTALVVPWVVAVATSPAGVFGLIGFDFDIYLRATSRWLAGGGFYLPHQLAGPYAITNGDVLYPPTAIYLFLPFLVLPGLLWWLLPIEICAAVTVRLRPTRLGLAGMTACLLPPIVIQEVLKGNPVIWAAAFEMLAVAGLPTGPLVALKASLFPFALVGVRRRSWWAVAGLMLLATLPLAGLVADWLTSVLNSSGGLLYSVKDVPLLLLPVAAGIARTRPRPVRAAASNVAALLGSA